MRIGKSVGNNPQLNAAKHKPRTYFWDVLGDNLFSERNTLNVNPMLSTFQHNSYPIQNARHISLKGQ